ncbi:hypothetical protein BKI52_33000 [marine bacterium AO1-C]|nr:hypothetical protein BKI52_33000 [marine bacterium AO1-C]
MRTLTTVITNVITTIFLSLVLYGCNTINVKLTVKNAENFDQQVKVIIKSPKASEKSFGILEANATDMFTFQANKKSDFEVQSSQPNSPIIFKSGNISISPGVKTFEKTITLKKQGRALDDSKALNTLSASFKRLGPNIGANPLGLGNALKTIIGALVVVETYTNKPPRILKIVSPNILGVKVITLNDIAFPPTNESEKVEISGNNAIQAGVDIPLVAKFGFNFSKSSVYQMRWIMRGFGERIKEEDPEKNPAKKIAELNPDDQKEIEKLLAKNDRVKLYYINRYYVLKSAEAFVKKAKKLNTASNFNFSNIVTADGVFTFENSTEENKGYGPVVLNYWGNEVFLTNKSFMATNVIVNKTNRLFFSGKQMNNYIFKK